MPDENNIKLWWFFSFGFEKMTTSHATQELSCFIFMSLFFKPYFFLICIFFIVISCSFSLQVTLPIVRNHNLVTSLLKETS